MKVYDDVFDSDLPVKKFFQVEVSTETCDTPRVSLDSISGTSPEFLTPAAARKLAKRLKRAARRAEAL